MLITLQFPKTEEQTWGVNFMRNIRQKNEQVFWAPITKEYRLTRVSLAGTMTGLTGLSRGMDLRVTPYILGGGKQQVEGAGLEPSGFSDVGVAGLWRLMQRIEEIKCHRIVIAVAGLDAAMPSVIGGLVPGLVIAVPTSTGYGAARGGETALFSSLVSCAPGVVVVNIDNGYGAACAALRSLRGVVAGH